MTRCEGRLGDLGALAAMGSPIRSLAAGLRILHRKEARGRQSLTRFRHPAAGERVRHEVEPERQADQGHGSNTREIPD